MKNHAKPMLIAILMASSLLTGCGSDSDKIVLKIGFWPEASETKDVAMYRAWAERFTRDYPQYKIEETPYTYSTETVGQKASVGQLPDVWQTWFTEPSKLKDKNIIRPITGLLDQFGWTDKIDDEMKEALTFNNEIYGIPRDGYGLGLLINKRILGDNGLLPEIDGEYSIYDEEGNPAYPTTFEDIYNAAEIISEYDSAKGFMMYSANKNGGWVFSNLAWNFGAVLQQQADGKWVSSLDDEGAIEALEWLKEMKCNDYLQESISCVYNDWYSNIGAKCAMAVVGSDVLQQAKLQGNVPMDDLAFVPMPTGDGIHHYSLYGGTPYVFTKGVSDEKVEGILRFFSYIGRSPSTDENNLLAKEEGYAVAEEKNQPILPTIMPWKNEDFVTAAKALENNHINVNMEDYSPFYDSIAENKHSEVPYNAQDMYELLDGAIQNVFIQKEKANCRSLLETANAQMQAKLDAGINA